MVTKQDDSAVAENVIRYISAVERASTRWFEEVSRFEKMDSAYYWPLLTQIYRNDIASRRTTLSDAEKFVPHLSASQVRRAITTAEESDFVTVSDPRKRPRYVTLTPKARRLIEDTACFAIEELAQIYKRSA